MPPGNPVRLLKLADREYRQLTGKPAVPVPSRKFKPMNLNPAKFDSAWDRKRGAAARLTAVILREDDSALEQRVCENERSVKVYTDAADWLQRESAYLRKVARVARHRGRGAQRRVEARMGQLLGEGSHCGDRRSFKRLV